MILILGCGRSGTHLLAEAMKGPDTIVTAEDSRWFDKALAIVRNSAKMHDYFPFILENWCFMQATAYGHGKEFVDKTHVAAWFYPEVKTLMDTKCIWIEREPLGAIASMKKHPGMRNDLRYAPCFSVPNRYMGIEDESWFDLPLVKCFAKKWKSYQRRRDELSADIDYYVQYEDLVRNPEKEISMMEKQFGIRCSRPTMHVETLDKWQNVLTQQEVSDINEELESEY